MAYLHEDPTAEGQAERAEAYRSVLSEVLESEDNIKMIDKGRGVCETGKPIDLDIRWTVEDVHGNLLEESNDFDQVEDSEFQRYTKEWEHSRKYQRNLVEGNERESSPFAYLFNNTPKTDIDPDDPMDPTSSFVTLPISMKEAKLRGAKYHEAVKKEVGRFMSFGAFGRPVARRSIHPASRIYRGKLIYAIKFMELEESLRKDKARLVVQGCLRILKNGRTMLDKTFRRAGEYWAPVGSLALLRYVTAIAAIQGLDLESTDLDSGYLQSTNYDANLYLNLDDEIVERFDDDWKAEIERQRELDRRLGGTGEVVFPVVKNVYGEAQAGQSFIQQYQEGFIQCGWNRCQTEPSLFYKRCTVTGRLQLLVSYVDDIAAAISKVDTELLWNKMRENGWVFSEEEPLERFIGIVVNRVNERCYHLSQKEYARDIVSRHEGREGPVRPRRTMPKDAPTPGLIINDKVPGVRSDIGALMYAARGVHPGLNRSVSSLASCANKWTSTGDANAAEFMHAIMGYMKGTALNVLNIDANGFSRSIEDWKVVGWGDADYRAPDCQTGVFIALMCVSEVRKRISEGRAKYSGKDASLRPQHEGILAWDWTSQKQVYVKLSVAEAEIVALSLCARSVNNAVATHAEVVSGEVDRVHDEIGIPEEFDSGVVWTDNEAARLAALRGFSAKMSHMNKTYGISLGWTNQRIESGELEIEPEPTSRMLADPLTKINNGDVFRRRGIIIAVASSSSEGEETENEDSGDRLHTNSLNEHADSLIAMLESGILDIDLPGFAGYAFARD